MCRRDLECIVKSLRGAGVYISVGGRKTEGGCFVRWNVSVAFRCWRGGQSFGAEERRCFFVLSRRLAVFSRFVCPFSDCLSSSTAVCRLPSANARFHLHSLFLHGLRIQRIVVCVWVMCPIDVCLFVQVLIVCMRRESIFTCLNFLFASSFCLRLLKSLFT